jgi:uncharacterized membrane protein HdeD (DUF308 family)
MSHHRDPWERESKDPAEKFLDYVSRAGIAITALLVAAVVVGLLALLVPPTEAVATVVFTGLLVAVVGYLYRMTNDRPA